MTLPTAPSRTMSQDTFDATTDAFIGALPQFEADMNALAAAMTLNATTDLSATSLLVGTGAKTLSVTAGKSFTPGMFLLIANTAAPNTNYMEAQVTSYSGTTLIVSVVAAFGSGTLSGWYISQSVPGTGYAKLSGAAFTGLVDLASGANIASAATIDLTAATGNSVTITGTTATSALTMNDGQHMTLVAAAAWPMTHNATTLNLINAVSYTCTAGDRIHAFKTGGVVYVVVEGAVALSGTYTPTLTNTTNIDASTAFATTKYVRVGNIVMVSGQVNIDATTAGAATVLGMSLPIASNLTAATQVNGGFQTDVIAGGGGGAVYGDTTNDRAVFGFLADTGANIGYQFWFMYQVL